MMQGTFVALLVLGSVVLIIAALCAIGAAVASKEMDRNNNAFSAVFLMILGGVLLSIAWYNAGQLNKRLPNLKSHHCTQPITHLEYNLGESYHTEVDQLIKAHQNSHCTGSIVVQYPGSKPITIPLK